MALLTLSSTPWVLSTVLGNQEHRKVSQEHLQRTDVHLHDSSWSQSNFSIITFCRILLISSIELFLLEILIIAVVLLLSVVVHLPVCTRGGQRTTLWNWSSSPIFTWVLRIELRSLSLLGNLLTHRAILLAYFLFLTVTDYSTPSSSKIFSEICVDA